MSSLNPQQFVDAVIQWANARNAQFKFNWPVKGGWEGWVQVDLTGFILATDGSIDILREQPIYKNPFQRTDLLLNTNLPKAEQIPVEIKAESFENHAQFFNGVNADVAKLTNERNIDYAQSVAVMLAIPFSPEGYQQVLDLTVNGQRIFTAVFIGEVACLMAIWQDGNWVAQQA